MTTSVWAVKANRAAGYNLHERKQNEEEDK